MTYGIDLQRLSKYKSPALALLVFACITVVAIRDSIGLGSFGYIHIFYLPAIVAAFWYGRRGLYLAALLAPIEMSLNYYYSGSDALLVLVDGGGLIAIAAAIGLLMERAVRLNARLADSDRLLHTSEAGYRTIFNAASDAIVLYDPATSRLVDVNEAWVQLSGFSVEESKSLKMAGLSTHDASFDDREPVQYVKKVLDGQAQLFLWMIRRKDGRDIWVEVNLKPITLMGQDLLIAIVRDVGERKRAEEKLRESEENYRMLVENSKDFTYKIDLRGVVLFTSGNVEKMTGYRADEVVGKRIWDFLAPECHDSVRETLGRRIRGEDMPPYEVQIVGKDGRHTPFELLTAPVFDRRGEVVGTQGVARDITYRKRAEAALRESEGKYRDIVEQVNDWVWEIDARGCYSYASPRVRELLGYGPGDVIGKMPYDLMPPGEAERVRALFTPVFEARQTFTLFENVLVRKDGGQVVVETSGTPMFDREGIFLGYRGIDRNVTERKRAEDARQESEAKFRALTEMTASAILILQGGRIKYANPAVEQITGYAREELLAMTPMEATSVIDPASVLKLNLVQFLRKKADGYRRYEIKLRTKDGQKKWVDVTTGIIDYDGSPAYLATGFDITERKQAEERLKASLYEKELLLKEIHHRVKNNLQVVSSMLNLQSAGIRDPAAASIFRESQDRVRSMAMIHERLYKSDDLSRIDFEAYVRNLTRHLMRSYNVRGAPIRLEIDAAGVQLGIDAAIPCGLIINELVSNALKYAFPDGRAGTIAISLRREGEQFKLTVADDGVGMPAHVRQGPASTLGLQLVTLLVDQLEGELRLSTEKGVAYTITFTPAEGPRDRPTNSMPGAIP